MANILLTNENPESFYDTLKQIMSRERNYFNDTVVIEGPFKETTRDGHVLGFVRLALTSKAFVIASGREQPIQDKSRICDDNSTKLVSFYPWKSVKLFVFKSSKRKCLKVLFYDNTPKYFVMEEESKTKIFWYLWRHYIKELNNTRIKWPFIFLTEVTSKNCQKLCEADCIKLYIIKHREEEYSCQNWPDKYLYLGSLRETEDQIRPLPVPGLGKSEDIKLFYLKPQYFGCWEQSEHWVQCGESSPEFTNK